MPKHKLEIKDVSTQKHFEHASLDENFYRRSSRLQPRLSRRPFAQVHLIFDASTIDKRKWVSYGFLCVSPIISRRSKKIKAREARSRRATKRQTQNILFFGAEWNLGKEPQVFLSFRAPGQRQIVAF